MADEERRTDRALARRCLAGEPGAWDELTRLYAPPVRDAVRRTLARFGLPADTGRVDDLAQEAFLQLLKDGAKALRLYRGDSSLAQYLQIVASYRTIDLLRKGGGPVPVPLDAEGQPAWRERVGQDIPHPLASLQAAELHSRLETALRRLPDRERLLLKAFYWDGLSTASLARLAGITRNHATVLLSRARERLGEILRGALAL